MTTRPTEKNFCWGSRFEAIRKDALKLMSHFPLAFCWIVLAGFPAFAQKTNDAEQTARIKEAVVKIGARTNSRVQVTRVGKPKVNGSINEIREDDFEMISSDNGSIGVAINIRYDEVVRIKGRGIDWRNGGMRASVFGLKALKVMGVILKGVNPQFPP